jgi:nitric oxide synthase oxygenase domain/subunit
MGISWYGIPIAAGMALKIGKFSAAGRRMIEALFSGA